MPELIGLLVGLVAGVLFPWAIPSQYSLYVAAGLLAALDSCLLYTSPPMPWCSTGWTGSGLQPASLPI